MTITKRIKQSQHESEILDKDRSIHRLKESVARLAARERELMQQLEISERRSQFLDAIDCEPNRDLITKKLSRTKGESTAILVLTDWHIGETVELEKTNGLNEFNLKIAERRVKRCFQKTLDRLELARKEATIDVLIVAILGDLISGAIHEELLESDEASPIESSIIAKDWIVSGLEFLLKESGCKEIIVPCVFGNHGRTTHKMRVATAAENSYEYFVYRDIESRFRGRKGITFDVSKALHCYQVVHGRTIRFTHGHAIKYSGGSGGISIPVNKAIHAWDRTRLADVTFFGHYHQFTNQKRWVACPSLVGYDAYSLFIKAEYQEPCQLFAVINGKYGNVESKEIFLEG